MNGVQIVSRFLEFSQLREEFPELRNKFNQPYLEVLYSLLHFMRTTNDSAAVGGRELCVTDRMPLANLIYDFLFRYDGQHSPRRIITLLRAYSTEREKLLQEDVDRVASFDFAFRTFASEMRKQGNYHVLFTIATNVSKTAACLAARDKPKGLNVRAYVASQNVLFRRAAENMGDDVCTLVYVSDFINLQQMMRAVCKAFPRLTVEPFVDHHDQPTTTALEA